MRSPISVGFVGRLPRRAIAVAGALLVTVCLAGCGTSGPTITTFNAAGDVERLPMRLMKPAGVGPFPAVVMLHDCSGLGFNSSGAPQRWAEHLVGRGFVVAIPDSFSPRGFPGGVCTDPSPRRTDVGPYRRVRDAYATLNFLRTLPEVDAKRIGLMGGSHGGTTTLATMTLPPNATEAAAAERRNGFAAAVALYPGCGLRLGDWRSDGTGVYRAVAPTLILAGEKDDWSPAAPCREMQEIAVRNGYPVSITVYPGAHHAFDSNRPVRYVPTRVNGASPTGRGATTGGDPNAWADAIRQVDAFFGRHLQPSAMQGASR